MNTSAELKNIHAALALAQAEMPVIVKSSSANKYKYAPLEDILRVTVPILAKHGLHVTQFVQTNGDHEEMVTRIGHTSGEFMEAALRMIVVPLNFSKAEINQQAVGSAISYYRRYCYVSALCLNVVGEDDDGNAAAQAIAEQKQEAVSNVTRMHLESLIKSLPSKEEQLDRFKAIQRYNRVERLEDLTEEQAQKAIRTFKK